MADQTSQPAPLTLQGLDENMQNININNTNHHTYDQHGNKKVSSGPQEPGTLPAECAEEKDGSPQHCISPATPKATILANLEHGQHGQALTPSNSQGSEIMVFFDRTNKKSVDNATKTRDPKQLVPFKLNPHFIAQTILDPSTTSQARDTLENQYTVLNGHFKQAAIQKDSYPSANAHGLSAAYNQHECPTSTTPFQTDRIHNPPHTAFTTSPLHLRIPSPTAHNRDAPETLGSTRNQTSPQRFKYATNIEELEQAADSAQRQNMFSDTKPGSLSVMDVTNWQEPARDGASSLQPPQASPPRRPTSSAKLQPVAGPVGWRDSRLPPSSFVPADHNGGSSHQPSAGYYDSNNRGTGANNRQFKPMVCVQNPAKANEMLNGSEILHRLRNGISLNYKGQSHNLNNISRDIPHSENAALWLTNLPPAVTVKELLGAIASSGPIGRVWSLHINPPKKVLTTAAAANHQHHQQGKINKDPNLPLSYRTSAAKLIFYQPVEAQRLLALAQRGEFSLTTTATNNDEQRHYQVHATHNRQRVPAQRMPNHTSRVLLISGPSWYVTEAQLHDLFRHFFVYQTEEVVVLADDGAKRVLEWRFGSMRAQAQAAFRLLKSPWLENIMVHVAWGTDPCETGGKTR